MDVLYFSIYAASWLIAKIVCSQLKTFSLALIDKPNRTQTLTEKYVMLLLEVVWHVYLTADVTYVT